MYRQCCGLCVRVPQLPPVRHPLPGLHHKSEGRTCLCELGTKLSFQERHKLGWVTVDVIHCARIAIALCVVTCPNSHGCVCCDVATAANIVPHKSL